MSWNIQDSTGDGSNKFENKNFLSILKQSNILCLQETKKQVKIEGYLSFNSNRKNSRSGGVCILVENPFRKGVSPIPCNDSEDIIAAKLDKNFFKLDFDLYLVCYYISPAYSSYVKKNPDYTDKTFSALNAICDRLRKKGEVAMCGDANARTGNLPDFILSSSAPATQDIYHDIGLEHDIVEPRNNSDHMTVEPHCQKFLDMVINNQLKILNGRTLGDSTGKMTCHKHNGSSVVDYFVITSWAREHVDSLQVKDFTSFSDHCPLILKMSTFEPFIANFQLPDFSKLPAGYKWDSDASQLAFISALQSPNISEKLETIINTEYSSIPEGSHKLNEDLTDCLLKAADTSLKAKKQPKNTSRKKWFDAQCDFSKRNLNRLANRLGDNVQNNILRREYFKQRNKHTNLVGGKKLAFLRRLNEAIEDGHVLDWKKFKNLKQENNADPLLDKHDLASFHDFFASLYKKPSQEPDLSVHAHKNYPEPPDLHIFNKLITECELA
jgi:exonuclease III